MQPVIKPYPRTILAGFSFFGDPFHSHAGWTETNEIGRLWQRLLRFWQEAAPPPQDMPTVSYEIHLQNPETLQTGEYEVFVGFKIDDVNTVPVELCLKILPEGTYAIFTLRGEQIQSDEPLIEQWLADAGYRQAFPFFAQCYDQRFKGVDRIAESALDILVPVVRTESDDQT